MARREYLFTQADSHSVQENQRRGMQGEIASMDGNRLLNTNTDDLVAYFAEKYAIEVPELLEDQMSVDQREAQRDVSGDPRRMAYYMGDRGPVTVTGTEIVVEIAFSGDRQMFKVRPSTFNMNPPTGVVSGNTITFSLWGDNLIGDVVRQQIDSWIANVKQWLEWQRNSFQGFSDVIAREARQAIEQRRAKLLQSQNVVASLGIPLKRRPDAPTTYTAPEVKRKLAPKLPPATTGPYKPEPILEQAEYQHVLTVMEGMVKVMERSPKAFHGLDEEGIRSHFLVQLNGHYEGQATGETFNYQGKTDILIRSGDRNVFIAECKFWGGPQKLTETIDQLLGYLSWRDSKTAILLFNRNRDFSKVLAAIPEVVRAHPNFQKEEGRRGETGFRYAFRHKHDPAKVLHLTVMAFDIQKPADK
jgi:hypothetical protein